MSNPIPDLLALTSIADGSQRLAAPIRNNFSAVQAAENELIAALSGGSAGQVLQAVDATHVQWATAGGLYRKTTAKQVVNSVAETDLLNGEITIAGNVLGSAGMLRLTARGDAINNGLDGIVMPRFKLKLGATTLLDTGAAGIGPWRLSAARYGWAIDVEIGNLGATNAQWATLEGRFSYHHGGNLLTPQVFTTGEGVVANSAETAGNNESVMFFTGSNAAAVDTTSAQALVLSVILGTASVSTDVTLKHALVEVV